MRKNSIRMMTYPVTWFSIAGLLILLLFEASSFSEAQQYSQKKQLDEPGPLEALRVSSLNRYDTGNYHTISPRPAQQPGVKAEDVVMNQIGKPLLVVLPPTQKQPQSQSQQKPAQQQRQQRQLYKQDPYSQQALAPAPVAKKQLRPAAEISSMTTSAPRSALGAAAASKWIEPDFQGASEHNGAKTGSGGSSQSAAPYQANSCRWISLKDMKSISFDTDEIIVRDALDQPCYIISIRAYIKFDEDAYFPLKDFKAYPNGAYRIDPYQSSNYATGNGTGSGSGGAAATALAAPALRGPSPPVNCSLPDNMVAGQQMAADYYLFQEEITLQVNCGYLVLQTRLDTANQLSLTGIAFYQDAIAISRGAFDLEKGARAHSAGSKSAPSTQSEHQVFSITGGAEGDDNAEQLIVMPMFSRYICQQRVVLTGNNSVQLVIERFELKRLTGMPGGPIIRPNARAKSLHGSATTRCPSPTGPINFSTSLMAPSAAASSDAANLPTASKHSGNKWTISSSSASSLAIYCQYSLFTILVSASLALIRLEAGEFVS